MTPTPSSPLSTPYTIIVDTREQRPFAFANLYADAADGRRPLHVQTSRACLPSGDYSLAGYETQIAVERKSLSDLFGTLGSGRRRFQNELQRLAAYQFAAVVVEAEWSEILTAPPQHSRLKPKTVHRSVIAWQQKYRNVHWWFMPDRAVAEVTTLRVLERFWKIQTAKRSS